MAGVALGSILGLGLGCRALESLPRRDFSKDSEKDMGGDRRMKVLGALRHQSIFYSEQRNPDSQGKTPIWTGVGNGLVSDCDPD